MFVWWSLVKKKDTTRFIHNFKEPIQYIQALWNETIIHHICSESVSISFNHTTQKITPEVLYKFFGMQMMRGIIGLRNMDMLWNNSGIVIDYPGKENSLSEDHFHKIASSLNFDPTFVHTNLINNFKVYMVPGYNITIDELRIPCRNELCPFKNHNRDKPDIWALESKSMHSENGYLLDFINPVQEKAPTPSESVFQFANWLKTTNRHHHLVFDSNFLSALDLLKLSDMGFEATASCKDNRPSFIWKKGLSHKLPRGYTRIASSTRLCCIATKNKGLPKLATTLCYAKENNGPFIVKERRDVLNIYDNLKGKADVFGRLYKAQFPRGGHRSWLTTLLVGWFYFALTNAYILYKTRFDFISHKEFVYQMACDFMLMK